MSESIITPTEAETTEANVGSLEWAAGYWKRKFGLSDAKLQAAAAKIAELETANHTLQVVVRSKLARIKKGGQLCKRFNADLEEVCEKLRAARQEAKDLEQSRNRWIGLAERAATQAEGLLTEASRLNAALAHSRQVSQARADTIDQLAYCNFTLAEEIHDLRSQSIWNRFFGWVSQPRIKAANNWPPENIHMHPEYVARLRATTRPTLIQRLRRLFHA